MNPGIRRARSSRRISSPIGRSTPDASPVSRPPACPFGNLGAFPPELAPRSRSHDGARRADRPKRQFAHADYGSAGKRSGPTAPAAAGPTLLRRHSVSVGLPAKPDKQGVGSNILGHAFRGVVNRSCPRPNTGCTARMPAAAPSDGPSSPLLLALGPTMRNNRGHESNSTDRESRLLPTELNRPDRSNQFLRSSNRTCQNPERTAEGLNPRPKQAPN